MHKTHQILGTLLCACLLLSLQVSSGTTAGPIEAVSARDAKFKTTVDFISSVPVELVEALYAVEKPELLVVTFEGSTAGRSPDFNLEATSFVQDIRVESGNEGRLRFFLQLKEAVPFSVVSSDAGLSFELYRIQPPQGDSSPDDALAPAIADGKDHIVYLEDIDIQQDRNGAVIQAKITEPVVYNIFALKNPLRLVVDLFNTIHRRPRTSRNVQAFGLRQVRSSQFQLDDPYSVTRIVFEMDEPQFLQIAPGPSELSFTFSGPAQVLAEQLSPEAVEAAPPTEETAPPLDEVQSKSETQKPPKVTTEEKEPVKADETAAQGRKPSPPPPEQPAVEEKAAAEPETEPPAPPVKTQTPQTQYPPRIIGQSGQTYRGDLISPVFKDADLRDVILYLGNSFGFNVVFDPEVKGTVTCDFKDIPWDQFIDIILKVNKMGRVIEGNILRIAPIDALTREQQAQRKLQESQELASPVATKSFRLSYAKAGEVQVLIQSRLSERGEIVVDPRTNTLIITDVSDRLALLERLVTQLDEANLQVSIEARVVEASSTYVRNIGIQWGWRGISDPFYGNQTSLQFPNKVLVDGSQIPTGITTRGIGGPLGGYAINLPAPAFTTAVGLSLSNVLDTFRIDMAISALESSGNGRIISSPNIVTQNNKPAEIIQGRQIPVQTAANFTVTTRYQNAALELRATPQITAKNTIIMTLEIKNDAPDFANLVQGIPPITTQSAMTTVEVPDGGTTVIGGIYRHEDSVTNERVPLLHKIPLLGNLFRSFSRTKQSRELLIFITPRIIRQ